MSHVVCYMLCPAIFFNTLPPSSMIFMCKLLSTLFLHCKLSLQTPNVCILVWGDNISLVLLEGRIDELQYGFFGGGGGGGIYTL